MRHFEREGLIWASKLDAESKLVLLALNQYLGSNETAWPSTETLANDTSLSERTILRRIKALESNCVVEKKNRYANKMQTSSEYKINWNALGVMSVSPNPGKNSNDYESYPQNQESSSNNGKSGVTVSHTRKIRGDCEAVKGCQGVSQGVTASHSGVTGSHTELIHRTNPKEEEFNKHTAKFCESEASQCVLSFDSGRVQPEESGGQSSTSKPLDETEPDRSSASSEQSEDQDDTKQSTRKGASSAVKNRKSDLMQRFEDRMWRRYPGTNSTGSKGPKSKAFEKHQALLRTGIPEEDIYAAFDWDLKRRKAKWDAGQFAESFPYLDRYLAQVNFKETLSQWQEAKNNPASSAGQDVRAAIGRILKERKLSGVLPDEWQDATGATLISELNDQQSYEFLNYLRREVKCA